MKKYIYIGILLFGIAGLHGQNAKTKKADELFDKLEYINAIEAYLELAKNDKNDVYVRRQLAEAYYNIFDTEQAEYWFKSIIDLKNDSETYYRYVQMLKANGKYDESNKWMNYFTAIAPNDLRAMDYINNPNSVTRLLNDRSKYIVKTIKGFNSKSSDHGPTLFKGQLFYVSARADNKKRYGWNDQSYLDLYVSDYLDGELSNERTVEGDVRTRFNEGTVSFSPDGKTMYFARESYTKKGFIKDNDGKSTINIYSVELVNGDWTNIRELPFNEKNFNTNTPAVSLDGKLLYFSSDMDGGYGNADLWVVEIKGNNLFGKPKNLGSKINTEGRECYPFISSKNILYFSSNGHNGLGNLDIYGTPIISDGFGSIRNVGTPINTGKDDFGFTINEEQKKGFFASNRDGGVGDDDIYAFTQIRPLCDVYLIVNIVDENKPLSGAIVSIYDENNNKVEEKVADSKGKIYYSYECSKDWTLRTELTEYEINRTSVPKTDKKELEVTVELIRVSEYEVGKKIKINPIYFPFDKHYITQKAAEELDKIVTIMKTYPSIKITANSHTDFRGSDAYNLALSDRRANSTRQYIISKGIDSTRITAEGKGEKEPVENCDTNCTEEQHQLNRRSEFIIVEK